MILEKLLKQRRLKKELGLNEDYTSGPWTAPNDTSYVGFFFEKDINSFSKANRQKYEETKLEIDKMEKELRELYGQDWRNIAVYKAYRLMRESEEDDEATTPPIEVRVGDEYRVWDAEQKAFVFSRKAEVAEETIRESKE